MKNNNGYIFILTLMMIAAATIIGTYIFIKGSFYVPYMNTMIQREKAKELALGGLQIAISQLGYVKQDATNKKQANAKAMAGQQEQDQQAKQFLTTILPVINRWQSYPLKANIDGINGEMNICIVCDDGKININDIYDFKQHKFKGEKQQQGDWRKIVEEVLKRAGQIMGAGDLFAGLEKFLKKRAYTLNDVTELLTIPEFAKFKHNVWYEPPTQKRKETIYLTDLFTVHSSGSMIEPWLFSDSLLSVLKFKQATPDEIESRTKLVVKWLKNFKESVQWKNDWNTVLKPVYGKDLPKTLESVLNSTFEPKWFSVISYGKVGRVTVRCVGIMERIKRASNGKTGYDVCLRKLYWL